LRRKSKVMADPAFVTRKQKQNYVSKYSRPSGTVSLEIRKSGNRMMESAVLNML
jgi:hypothetical protein